MLVDYIGRFESLNEGFTEVCRQFGVSRASQPHLLRSGIRGYQKYYNARTQSLGRERFALDIDLFDYQFDGD